MAAGSIKGLFKRASKSFSSAISKRARPVANDMIGRGVKNVFKDAVKNADDVLLSKGVLQKIDANYSNLWVGRKVSLGYSLGIVGAAGAAGVGVGMHQNRDRENEITPYTAPSQAAMPYSHVFGPPRRVDNTLGATGEIPLALHRNR